MGNKKQAEAEKKLRDHVESFTNNYDFWEAPDEQYVNEKVIELVKTKEVADYHQSMQPKLDGDVSILVEALSAIEYGDRSNEAHSMASDALKEYENSKSV